jgi:competence protein ComGC
MFAANSLIKKYGEKAVVRAVMNQKSVFSLKNKRIIPEIKKQINLIEEESKRTKQELDVKKEAKTRKKSYGKKSSLNKLRGLNGKKESEE